MTSQPNHSEPPRHLHNVRGLEKVRISWAVDDKGILVDCNSTFCWAMHISAEEALHHLAQRLLRPHTPTDDPELDAIREAMQRLKSGESDKEHIDSWIVATDDTTILLPDAIMAYREPLWHVYADIDIAYMPRGPQFRTPWDQIEMQNFVQAQTVQRVRNLTREVSELKSRLKPARKPRKHRSDKGNHLLATDEDFEASLRKALEAGATTVTQVLEATHIGRGNTLEAYLQRFWADPEKRETPLRTIRRLGQAWYPDRYLV